MSSPCTRASGTTRSSIGGPETIGAPLVWGPDLANAGDGIKIGIIDDGIDQSHPFFQSDDYEMPTGFPRGVAGLTTAKVIVARAFAPPGAGWKYATRPFDPVYSFHGTHVAGIAGGNQGTVATFGGGTRIELSGVAPRAYLGNYKALTYPTDSGLGLNGNSPEIVAAIEAAVADGMDVINLSLGEPQIDPKRDAVAKALDNAAAAGVVPVVSAGNDFQELGVGSVGSPGTSRLAITVGATAQNGAIASFSASGPTPLGEDLKPDVSAPGVDILSSVPQGAFEEFSGTSMASPHVAGGAALLREAHPDWTVEQIKSSLVLTATPVRGAGSDNRDAPATRQGGGQVDLLAALSPVLFAAPQTVSFGLLDVRSGAVSVEREVVLSAASGPGTWSVSIETQGPAAGVSILVPDTVEVPGAVTITASAAQDASEGEQTGFVILTRDGLTRRLPFWFRVTRPMLPGKPFRLLSGPGPYHGNTRGQTALVDRYRYPEVRVPSRRLAGPEQVFRLVLDRPVANVGVAITSRAKQVDVEPRLVLGADENRLAGVPALPIVANPYLSSFSAPVRSAAMLLPSAGTLFGRLRLASHLAGRPVRIPPLDRRRHAADRQTALADRGGRDDLRPCSRLGGGGRPTRDRLLARRRGVSPRSARRPESRAARRLACPPGHPPPHAAGLGSAGGEEQRERRRDSAEYTGRRDHHQGPVGSDPGVAETSFPARAPSSASLRSRRSHNTWRARPARCSSSVGVGAGSDPGPPSRAPRPAREPHTARMTT